MEKTCEELGCHGLQVVEVHTLQLFAPCRYSTCAEHTDKQPKFWE